MEQEVRESQKDVSSKFLDVIFDSIKRLEEHERLMKEGCSSLREYMIQLKLNPNNFNNIQVKNMTLMVTEFEIVFRNIKEIVGELEFKKLKEKLGKIQVLIVNGVKVEENKYNLVFGNYIDKVRHISHMKINDKEFFYVATQLAELRGEVVSSLSKVLYSKTKNRGKPKHLY